MTGQSDRPSGGLGGSSGSQGPAGRAWWRRRTSGLDGRYWRLWAAVASSNLGDGLVGLAFPWLASLLTRDPLLIAGVGLATRLPWLLFSLQAGVLGDRMDRRRLMVTANSVRAVVAGAVAVAVVVDAINLPVLYVAAFVLGMCEVAFDNTTQALVPALVARERLERANGNLMGAQMVIAEFVARPLSGALVGVALSLPFAIDAVTAGASAALVATIPGTFRGAPARPGAGQAPRPPMRAQIAEGLRWLWGHRLLRTLALALAVMNGTSAAVMATYVLFAQEILRLDGLGFGLLLAAGSVGALLGSVVGPNVAARLRPGPTLLLAIVVPIASLAITAVTSSAVVVAVGFSTFGFTAIMWNVVTVSLRQAMIPDAILGRVNSVYRFLGWGAMPIGTLAGGALVSVVEQAVSRPVGLRAPFAAGAVIHLLLLAAVGTRLTTRAVDEAKAAAGRG